MVMFPAAIIAMECDDDREYMTGLYRSHRLLMLKIAQQYASSREDAADIVSESCARLIEHLPQLRALEQEKLRPYIAATVRNVAINLRVKEAL